MAEKKQKNNQVKKTSLSDAGRRDRVVIVGSGFGGLWAARTLSRYPVDVLVLDRNNYHTFLALLYQVAADELYAEDIAYPIRSIISKLPNVTYRMADVSRIDFESKVVIANTGSFAYDYLIIATGSVTQFYDIPGAAERSFKLKSLEEGIALRNHIICCFERASSEQDPDKLRSLLTFVIVGGGSTGVEYAGALAELVRGRLVRDYPSIDFGYVRIILLEAGESLLAFMPEKARDYVPRRLIGGGVDVRLKTAVAAIDDETVRLKSGEIIETQTVVWTAGVRGAPLSERSGLPVTKDGRVKVLPTIQTPDRPEVYVVGDVAYIERNDMPLPQVAQVAIQSGKHVAQNIGRQIAGKKLEPFEYIDKGTMVSVGRNAAAVRVGNRSFTGFFAWLLWIILHIFYLIGFRNRIMVMINWAWDYILYERPARIVFPRDTVLLRKAAKCAFPQKDKDRKDKDDEGEK